MNTKWIVCLLALSFLSRLSFAEEPGPGVPSEKIQHLLSDEGRPFLPEADRKGFPEEVEQGYKLMIDKCGQCHKPTRPLNTIMYDVEDWKRYVKRMMSKPNSNISEDEGKAIYRFLKHDQLTRKEKSPEKFLVPHEMERPPTVTWFSEEKKPKNW